MAVVPVDIVNVVPMGDDLMAATVLVHVHVPCVIDVPDEIRWLLVHVIIVDDVYVTVVEEVHVILVRHGRVPAEAVVDMRVPIDRKMWAGPAIVTSAVTVARTTCDRNAGSGPHRRRDGSPSGSSSAERGSAQDGSMPSRWVRRSAPHALGGRNGAPPLSSGPWHDDGSSSW